jgi:hypothetical protein
VNSWCDGTTFRVCNYLVDLEPRPAEVHYKLRTHVRSKYTDLRSVIIVPSCYRITGIIYCAQCTLPVWNVTACVAVNFIGHMYSLSSAISNARRYSFLLRLRHNHLCKMITRHRGKNVTALLTLSDMIRLNSIAKN